MVLGLSSYSPEKDGKSFDEAAKIWEDSKLIDETTKRTQTGLYTYFISVLDSGEENFDVYGHCDQDKTRKWVSANREQRKNDSADLQTFTRQYPMIEEEMWAVGGGGKSVFDNLRLGMRKKTLTDELKHNIPYEVGNLVWMGEHFNSEVRAIPLTDAELLAGKKSNWTFYHRKHWPGEHLNRLLAMKRLQGNGQYVQIKPDDFSPWCAAWDPADFVGAADVQQGSKHACVVESFFDMGINGRAQQMVTGQMHAVYTGRHDNPEDDMMELIKGIHLWGGHWYIESNKPWMLTLIKKYGLQRYIMVRDSKGKLATYNEHIHQKLPATNKAVIDNYCTAIAKRLAPPPGGDGFDWLSYNNNLLLIDQLMRFKTEATKLFDVAVAYGLVSVLLEVLVAIRIKNMSRGDVNTADNQAMAEMMRYVVYGI